MFMCSADTYRADFTSPVSTADERTPLEILKPISFAVAGPERLATHSRRSAGHCDERHVRRVADGCVQDEPAAGSRSGKRGNLTDRLNVINFAGLFAGTALALPRSFWGPCRVEF
jgi:hypothetical protein